MNKKILLIILVAVAVAFLVFAAPPSQPGIFYPSSIDIRINTGTEINWTNSSDADGDVIRYNLFYSNDSGTNWYPIAFDWGYENKLNDSSTDKNLTFTGNENKTIYINMPKVANITSAKLNLTGYPDNLPGDYISVYNSFSNEGDNDGNAESSGDSWSLARVGAYYPVDVYLLVYTPPSADIKMIGLSLGGMSDSPQTKNLIYDIYIAETNGYLTGDPIDDNTTSYTEIRNEINLSAEFGTSQNVYKNITLDTTYSMSSAKKYILWFKFVDGVDGANYGYSIRYDSSPINNYTASRYRIANDSYSMMSNIYLYGPPQSNSSNVWLEVGDTDGNREWNYTGNFSLTNTTEDFKFSLQSYIDNNCTADLWDNCSIPITIHSDTIGKIEISGIDIQFTDYWWNTSNIKELTTYKVNITPSDGTSNGSSSISANDFIISHNIPNVTLNFPIDSYSNSSSDPVNVEFNCSANDDWGLANISLYITDKNNQSFSLNQSKDISGTSNTTNWTLSLNNGDYTWACLAYDLAGNYNWSNNRSIKINYTAPATPVPSSGGRGGIISKTLFDVKILKFDFPANISSLFNFTYFVKGIGNINQDIVIKFGLEKENKTLSSGFDTIYFGVNEEYTENTQLSLPSTASEGIYDFYVEAVYGQYSAKASRKIEIILPERKENATIIDQVSVFSCLNFLKKIGYYILTVFGFLLILFLLFLLLRKKKKRLHNLGSIKGTKIVSEEGVYMGDVEDVYLKGNDIHGWLIKPRKTISKKIKDKKFLIKNKDVKKIGEIMIVDKKISDFFK